MSSPATNDHRFLLTFGSGNTKTGPMAVSTTDRSSCPDSCPLKDAECFGEGGRLRIHWDRLSAGGGLSWEEYLAKLATAPYHGLWRHDQAGDLPGQGDTIDGPSLLRMVKVAASRFLKGFTYSHKPLDHGDNKAWIQVVNREHDSLTINVSTNSPTHLDAVVAAHGRDGLDYVTVLPPDAGKVTVTPGGETIVWCPAQWSKGLTCSDCGKGKPLCRRKGRKFAVGFKPHGMRARRLVARLLGGAL